MARVRRIALRLAGVAVVGISTSAAAQGNIDAGKTPAQIFSDTCSACHRNVRELKRTNESFLRAHYVPSREEAAAMAGYLAAVASNPRAAPQQKRTSGVGLGQTPPADIPTRARPAEQAKSTPPQGSKASPPQRESQPSEAKPSPPRRESQPSEAKPSPLPQPESHPPPQREQPVREAQVAHGMGLASLMRVRRPAGSLEASALTMLVAETEPREAPPSLPPPLLEEIEE